MLIIVARKELCFYAYWIQSVSSVSQGNDPYPWPMVSTYPLPKYYILDVPKTLRNKQGKNPQKD